MCGEHVPWLKSLLTSRGSSPRVRGTLVPVWCGGFVHRDHPRVCGEHFHDPYTGRTMRGSSPRVRGTPGRGCGGRSRRRIIPACAGNTRTPRGFRTGRRDHPRVCGEHSPHDLPGAPHQGSSPRVRGTRPHRPRWHSGQGIIPACAGNTWTEGLRPGDAGDHPRVCGEHAPPLACLFDARGSSPRVRGTLRRRRRARAEIGIIPACAGNTAYVLSAFSSSRDHPRVCGEHELPELRQAAIRGSSPRVRGTPPAQPIRLLLAGIIPACAGNTLWRVVCYVRGRDHPRVCGEHSLMPSPSSSASGSSPRVRGTPDGRRKSVEDMGIIPACAGNTVRWMSW